VTETITHAFDYWGSGGLLLVPLAVVCFGIWGYLLRTRALFRRCMADAQRLLSVMDGPVQSVREQLSAFHEATAGMLAAVCRQAVALTDGGERLPRAFQQESQAALALLRRDFIVLATLTVVAPLIGLLGTVVGMVETFQGVAGAVGETTGRVADGISQALITTQFGLVVAIPGVFGLARLYRLESRLQTLLNTVQTHLLQAEAR